MNVVNPTLLVCFILLSLVNESWQQSDSCSYQGQQVNGEFTIPGLCLLYRCIPGQGVTAIGCGIRIPPEGCYVEHPNTKNYPECCYSRVVCPEANSINSEQTLRTFDQSNATSFEQQNLGYPRFSSLPPFANQPAFSTDRPQTLKTLTPPLQDVAPNFRPKSPQNKRPPNGAFSEFQNSQRDEDLRNGPYYYKK
ncbi:uncharacterized protein LOC123308288 [Coccinella septempunctata]|uniref:uncharacterized protein LOC123308288 n=1 Tax=Coccinella septempunctata TaxID=41139 RepID=UPI001D06743F|nr:uncharacterized protein LOC123308288 [Coccinella septempunctata]